MLHRSTARLSCLGAAACLLFAMTPTITADPSSDPAVAAARTHVEAHGPRILGEFVDFLRIPNHAHDPTIRQVAEWARDELAKRGAAMELLELDDPSIPPIVYGRLDAPGATRTFGIYVHYDGQPVQPELWMHDPFEPVLYTRAAIDGGTPRPLPGADEAIDPDWRVYARAAADDKAPIPAMIAAIDALETAGIERTSNLIFFFEGEEEIGSTHLGEYMERYAEKLKVDGWLICDGPAHQSGRPQLVFGIRGVVDMEITVYGAIRGLHSGHYGNWAPNPAMMLSRLLASMKDDEGLTTIPGYHEGEMEIDAADREAMASVPSYETELRDELGIARVEGGGASLLERVMTSSLNVRGLWSAGVGDKARNVVPSHAIASIDLRLAKGVEPAEMIARMEAHIARQGYHIVRDTPTEAERREHPRIAKIESGEGYRAVRTPIGHPFAQAVIGATRRAGGDELVLMPTLGGSLPLYLFEDKLGAPLIVVPFANHDNNQHAPNENLRLGNLWQGIDLMAALFTMAP
ncbi:MAG: M20/M25/M40 family metallo-hydrolase [Acidobacteriota bacterium]